MATALGCGPLPTLGKGRFDAVGEYRPMAKTTPRAASPRAVKVFYGTSPAGFSLRDNELKVEPGFGHQILGTVSVREGDQHCSNEQIGATSGAPIPYRKNDVIAQMQETAYEHGGTAVIYAESYLSDQADGDERCKVLERHAAYGNGWVVVLGDAPQPAAPVTTTTPPPAPSAAPATP